MTEHETRRPLKVRGSRLAQRAAQWLSRRQVTPNQISVASVGFAVAAAVAFWLLPRAPEGMRWVWPLAAAVFIQCRLLCNLFDGMVAVEGGKGTPSGELFNDVPDRISDALILVALGHAAPTVAWAPTLGWAAALGSVATAYLRTLAASLGAPVDFRGPMAKQHRMALVTGACLLAMLEPWSWGASEVFASALVVVVLGCVVTLIRRARAAYQALEGPRHAD